MKNEQELTKVEIINNENTKIIVDIKNNFKEIHPILSRIPLINRLMWREYYNKTLDRIDRYFKDCRVRLFREPRIKRIKNN